MEKQMSSLTISEKENKGNKSSGARPKTKGKNDRMTQGAIKIKPIETPVESRTKPPDATIVVEGVKYQVRKKGKAKKTTQDGLYHNKNKPEASKKKLEKALLAWAIVAVILITPVAANNITQWNLWDNKTEVDIHSVMYQRNVTRSLHGIWPEKICKGVPPHLATDYELKRIKGMMDASPNTNFTCCRLQRHEWNKHGFCNWYNIEPWLQVMNQTQQNLTSGNTNFTECAVTCRYDETLDLNIVTQARNTPTFLTGCKKSKNFSFSGEIRTTPCNIELSSEDLLNLLEHTKCDETSYFGEKFVDGITEAIEVTRSRGFQAFSWLEEKVSKTKKRFFGAEASPYCNITSKLGNIITTNSCTPLGLPSSTKIIGQGKFDLSGLQHNRVVPRITHHLDQYLMLGLVALAEFMPETASAVFLVLHYTIADSQEELLSEGLDENQLNLTVTDPVTKYIPKSIWMADGWVCIKPSWWPYASRIGQVISGVTTLIDFVIMTIEELVSIWTEATAVAFLAALIKVIRGKPIHAILWLIVLGGTQAEKLDCKSGLEYALARDKDIGLLGPTKLTTQWYRGNQNQKLSDGNVHCTCKNGEWVCQFTCKQTQKRFLAINHPQALPTSAWFKSLGGGSEEPNEELMADEKYAYLCPCNANPVVQQQNFNATRIKAKSPAFYLECPIGWKGIIKCVLYSEDTLELTTIYSFKRFKPYGNISQCKTQLPVGEDLMQCKLGGNDSCVIGEQVKGKQSDNVTHCDWCGYRFNSSEDLPMYPLGKCRKRDRGYRRLYKNETCCRNNVCIDKEKGTVECMIGNTKVKVYSQNETILAPMPCKPILIKSQGPPKAGSCTYKWAYTLKNKYYEPRDQYFLQYMVKDEYQYWFDLKAGDHAVDLVSKYLPILIVALLGGKAVLWILVAYTILVDYQVEAANYYFMQAESLVMGNILMSLDIEKSLCYLVLIAIIRDVSKRRILGLLYHCMTMSPWLSITACFIYLIGLVRAEDDRADNEAISEVHIPIFLVFIIVYNVKNRNIEGLFLLFIVFCLKTTGWIQPQLYEIPLLMFCIVCILTFYIVDVNYRMKKIFLLVGLSALLCLVRCLWLARNFLSLPVKEIYWITPNYVLLAYLCSLTILVNNKIDIVGPILTAAPYIFSFLTLWADVIVLIILMPWYEVIKVYYLKRKKQDVEQALVCGGIAEQTTSPYCFDTSEPLEGVHVLPSQKEERFDKIVLITLIRSIITTSFSTVWRPLIIVELLIEALYWAHIKIAKEVAGSTRLMASFLASIIELNWKFDNQDVTKYKKFQILSSRVKDLILKHKVRNETVKKWFEETEIFGLQKIVLIVRAQTLSNEKFSILCSVCEAKENRNAKRPCPKCKSKGTQIKCGMTLAEFEEKHYKKIYIMEGFEEEQPYRKEERLTLTYTARGALLLRNLPILATKNKYLLVGNLGMEISDLEAMGWILRGPAVCKKIVGHEQCKISIPDKLMAFFGMMPRGTTPRAPTRLPVSLLKIKRGLESGWAYTHVGGVSSVTHVTAGQDLFVSDSIGRTKILCQSKNAIMDECEYGIKTDSGCPDGTRCYVLNPEATNIAGTKGAMVHLKKVGGEFNCVTAQGTPAFYNLSNLRGWSGLPIFDSSTGNVVGRVKAGKNRDNEPTTIMSGVQTAKPSECDLESIVRKLEVMNRGEFKQVTLATGAGKTTELPRRLIETIGRHKRILVLIPLRAAAEGVYNYMKVKHPSIAFNLRIGDMKEGDMATGITYASYGYFCQMDMPRLENAIKTYNYVFFDEYHCATPEQLAVMSKVHRFSEFVRAVAMTATPTGAVSTTGQKYAIEEIVVPEVMRGEDLTEQHIEIAGLKILKKELDNNVLVFVSTKKLATENAKRLKNLGYNAGFYFSGEDPSSIRTITAKSPYIVVATNAIESGVTLPDLDTVIDTCLKCEKRLRIEPTAPYIITGLKKMAITIGEQAQRKGRVGRVKPGRYLRGPENCTGEKDYHYDLLQAQRYGLQDGINITKSFREMNYDWALFEEDTVRLAQLEVLNNILVSQELPTIVKNIMARTTHPEPIQLAYNGIETPVPVLFPIVKNGEVTDKYETFELMNCRKLEGNPPVYLYATEEEDLAVDLLNLKWPPPSSRFVLETEEALRQIVGLSSGETALLIALLGWVGYEALCKRHVPIVTDIYTIEEERLEDTTHLQYAPDELHNSNTVELTDLSSNLVQETLKMFEGYFDGAVKFMKIQAETVANSDKAIQIKKQIPLWIAQFLEYLKENSSDIKKYGLWGVHTALYNSITARLGHETAFASLVIKWLAFSGGAVPDMVKQAAVDLVVYYIFNKPEFAGDKETQDNGRKFVGAVFVSALANYTFKNFDASTLENVVKPALNYLPYCSKMLNLFVPTKLESIAILATTIYRTYISIKKGSSQGLAGLAASSAMEIMSQNPISVAIAVALGVGAIAAHNAIESSETKRTLLMKVFVKNFLDQAATDELVKENPEKIIMAVFEAIQTAGNPLRLIYHLYAMFYKNWTMVELADRVAGRNIFVLIVFEGLELLGLDKDSKWRNLSNNYLVDAIKALINKLLNKSRNLTKNFLVSLLPAPFSCTRYKPDRRIGLPTLQFDRYETICTCGYKKLAVKTEEGEWQVLEEVQSTFCVNQGVSGMNNIKVTTYYFQGEPIKPIVERKGIGQILVKGVTILIDFDQNIILGSDQWDIHLSVLSNLESQIQGIGFLDSFVGTKPNFKAIIQRKCLTITNDRIKFLKCSKGVAFTKNLNVDHIKQLIKTVKMNGVKEGVIPQEVSVETWINLPLINEDIGNTRPSFGEKIIPEPFEEDPIEQPSVRVDESSLMVNLVGVNQQCATMGSTFVVGKETTAEGGNSTIKLGLSRGMVPGNKKLAKTLNEIVSDEDPKPFVYICGSNKSMSNRAKTARNIRFLKTEDARYFRDLAREGKVIIILLGEFSEEVRRHGDFKGKFLTRDSLQALSNAKAVKKQMTLREAKLIMEKHKEEEFQLPDWFQWEEPKFMTVTKSTERFGLIGDIEFLKRKAVELGATTRTEVKNQAGTYIVNLSTWWESHKVQSLKPLFDEQIMKCRPVTKSAYKKCHFVNSAQLSKGNWKPVAPVVSLGEVPAVKEKILPYEAYILLKRMIEDEDKRYDKGALKKEHNWILNKIVEPGELALKNLVAPGRVKRPVVREKRKHNIYNKKITGVMLSIGIKPERLPVVRAQTSTKDFHQSIREKIDKKPNRQNPELHTELLKVFNTICKVKDKESTFSEVEWDVLMNGINRKGAAGFFENENIGEIIESKRKVVENLIKKISRGERVDYYETAIPKNEKRGVVDDWLEGDYIDEKKPRVIQYPEAKMRLAISKVMYNWVKQKPVVIPGYEGKTPLFKVFDKVFDEWKQFKEPVAVSFDTKAWDTQVTPNDLKLISEVQKYYFKKKYHKFIDNLTSHMLEVPVVCEDGEVYIREGQRGSGQPDTSAGNSMLNVLTMIYAFCKANDMPYTAFSRVAKIHVCGDDGFLITEKNLGEKFSMLGPQILMEAGKPQKLLGEIGLKIAYRFQDIEFCSHTPIQVRWEDNTTSHMPGRDTATVLAKMATRLDSTGERGTEGYEAAVAFSFLLMYSWNPLIRRICLYVLSTVNISSPSRYSTIYTFSGDPIAAYREVHGRYLHQLKHTEFEKLAQCNLSMSLLGIFSKHTTKRLIEDCVKLGKKSSQAVVNADRLISKKTGHRYQPDSGHTLVGKHYEEIELQESKRPIIAKGIERYVPGPIKTILLKRLKILEMIKKIFPGD
ncbi:polyprotein [Phocoena pestivirus]|uniref:Genome polyprotein n=1 Tax=Phocoena pestivirus TaxID=2653709 RepID=A0A5P8HZL6_9FLAV|nr:polyprotein [Phocoena pestivirus]QFQ60722.1 polyprotein [Phocoena pestivirus]